MRKTMICMLLLLSLLALASAQENITQGNITQELNADLNAAFRDILSNSNGINNSTQMVISSPFADDIGSIDNNAAFIEAEQQFNYFASLSHEQIEEMWLRALGRPWGVPMSSNPPPGFII